MSKIDVFCDQLGIGIVPYSTRKGRWETNARQSLRWIAKHRGEGHLSIVLKAIKARPENAMELWSETILAVSDVLTAFPELEARGGELLDQFEELDLASLRQQAKMCTVGGVTTRQALTVLLASSLAMKLVPVVGP
ncbi:hypothetical protein [Kaistia terrae]|uniref:Uncharacterized protein n=1 Tax=Kaistia terrae TaxID=537017 RepID=A0ABW0PV64_9HYPH|nr:hypothetical protein [Kaistia terrae]MCX5579454.1 hypothetical protein [Kaistia terrae]